MKMHISNYLALTLTFGIVMSYWSEPSIPEYLHICEKKDSNLTECLKTSIEILQSVLINGIPNVDVPSFDPLKIGDLFKFDKSRHGLQVKVWNIVVLGILKFKIEKLHVIKHGKLYRIDVLFPKLQIEGGCELSGSIEEFVINENCSFVESFHNSTAVVRAHFNLKNEWMVQTEKIDITIKTGKGVVELYDLDNGRRIFDRQDVDNVINHHFDKMNKNLVFVIEKLLQHQLKEMSNQVFGNFSIGQIFPLSF
ncbi:uncharacterized protein LOC116347314 [Contarinia nasturtii]|uniref:uncharacterized protein LOC116347314 n=1 Tax=Contarinia nasturtii TaxID=265458 RepID=UPI0012D3BBA4|nr:uncharacterized protein LOC116347314 [Contarinia nasturtii]